MRSIAGAPALRIARERDKLKEMEILATVTPARALTSNPIAYGSLPLRVIIFGQILASSGIGPSWRSLAKLLRWRELLVEQRGVEPLTSALRTRRSAKLSYCPTWVAILGSAVDECQACADRRDQQPQHAHIPTNEPG